MPNEYRKGPLITTSGGRKVWSFSVYLEECYTVCGERSTRVLDEATNEWNCGKKNINTVEKKICQANSNR